MMGSFEDAQACFEEALAIREAVLGEDHVDTAASLNNLGMVIYDLGDYKHTQ